MKTISSQAHFYDYIINKEVQKNLLFLCFIYRIQTEYVSLFK